MSVKKIDWEKVNKVKRDLESAADLAKQSRRVLNDCRMNLGAAWRGSDVGRVERLLEEYEVAYASIEAKIEKTIQGIEEMRAEWSSCSAT